MTELILKTIIEGIGLGVLLVLVCAVGIRKGAVGMVHLYSSAVQDRCVKLGMTTHEKIKRNSLIFKAVCIPGYVAYVWFAFMQSTARGASSQAFGSCLLSSPQCVRAVTIGYPSRAADSWNRLQRRIRSFSIRQAH